MSKRSFRSHQPTSDSFDPRLEGPRYASGAGKFDRKSSQLCAQVRRALEYAIPDVLAETPWSVWVVDVQPAPNASNLLVLIQSAETGQSFEDLQQIEQSVHARQRELRMEIASFIQRRKVPSLMIRLLPS
jgi:ribosome-binding factor A